MIHALLTGKHSALRSMKTPSPDTAMQQLMQQIGIWVEELGFAEFGVSDIDLSANKNALINWLEQGHHGDMDWLSENIDFRLQPEKLVEGTCRIISVRLNYLPEDTAPVANLKNSTKAYISRYALGRDYHKLMRKRLAKLGKKIETFAHEHQLHQAPISRAFVDSAPVLERPIAEKAGLGWTGKHTLVLNAEQGSWFFLGELFTNIPLPLTTEAKANQCGDCKACMQICPTDAFPSEYELDARRCISYLTIEYDGVIPEEFREPIGNRIFGCDDCQLICPWNKVPTHTKEHDFQPRHQLSDIDLIELFNWSEETFLKRTEGSAIRRTGHQNWLRNIAIALGNAEKDIRIIETLKQKREHASALLIEHIDWAIERQLSSRRRKRKIKRA